MLLNIRRNNREVVGSLWRSAMSSAGADNATRCTMQTFGTFSTLTYGGVGEPYGGRDKGAPQHMCRSTSLRERHFVNPTRRNRLARQGPPVHDQQAKKRSNR